MPLDIALLAASAVGNVLLPFFQRSAEQVAADVTQKVGEGAANYATATASALWERIKSRFSDDSDRVIAERFERDPEAAAPLLESDLKRKLEEDPAFAAEIAALIEAESPDGSGNVMQIFGTGGIVDARGASVHGGVLAGYVGNVQAAPPVPPSPNIGSSPETREG